MNPAAISILVSQAPVLIACLVGVGTCLVLFRRRKLSAGFALGGFTLLLLANLSSIFATNWLMNQMREGVDAAEVGLITGLVHISASIATAVALILLLIAVFIRPGHRDDG